MASVQYQYQYFGSGVGIGELSNFASVTFELDGQAWPSSEHAYQACAKVHKDDWRRFGVDGDLGSLESGLKRVFPERDYAKKLKHYSAKGSRPEMVGIVAKMAVRPDIAKKLGLRLMPLTETEKWMEAIKALFVRILFAKYKQNPAYKALLMGTGTQHLVEFSRGAERETLKGRPPLWTGMVVNGSKLGLGLMVGGELMGQNLQGELQMMVRRNLSSEA